MLIKTQVRNGLAARFTMDKSVTTDCRGFNGDSKRRCFVCGTECELQIEDEFPDQVVFTCGRCNSTTIFRHGWDSIGELKGGSEDTRQSQLKTVTGGNGGETVPNEGEQRGGSGDTSVYLEMEHSGLSGEGTIVLAKVLNVTNFGPLEHIIICVTDASQSQPQMEETPPPMPIVQQVFARKSVPVFISVEGSYGPTPTTPSEISTTAAAQVTNQVDQDCKTETGSLFQKKGEICEECYRGYGLHEMKCSQHPSKPPKILKRIRGKYRCTLCSALLPTEPDIYAHLIREHEADVREVLQKCNVSPDIRLSQKVLRTHVKPLLVKRPRFTCPHCDAEFITRAGYENHVVRHVKRMSFTCPICSARFDDAVEIDDHMVRCRPIEEVEDTTSSSSSSTTRNMVCTRCGLVVPGQKAMRIHLAQNHLELYKYKCKEPDCDARYMDSGSLAVHKKAKHGGQVFKCQWCLREYPCQKYLNQHVKHGPCGKGEEISSQEEDTN